MAGYGRDAEIHDMAISSAVRSVSSMLQGPGPEVVHERHGLASELVHLSASLLSTPEHYKNHITYFINNRLTEAPISRADICSVVLIKQNSIAVEIRDLKILRRFIVALSIKPSIPGRSHVSYQ